MGMRIRMTRQCPAVIDGFSIAQLVVGRVYDIKDPTAQFLIATECAEPYQDEPLPDELAVPRSNYQRETS
jgi:hypothetical protein